MIPKNNLLLTTDGLAVGHDKILVADITLGVGPGECILLCGANGCGKSTLLRTFAGVIPPLSGQLRTAGTVLIPTRIPKIPGFTLSEFIRVSFYRGSAWNGRLGKRAGEAMATALQMLDIADLSGRDIATLSDGEFQRGCIAAALVRLLTADGAAGLILLDEPTAFLDVEGRMQVLRVLRDIVRQTGASVLFSSHDLAEARTVATRLLGITPDGRLRDARPEDGADLLSACFPAVF